MEYFNPAFSNQNPQLSQEMLSQNFQRPRSAAIKLGQMGQGNNGNHYHSQDQNDEQTNKTKENPETITAEESQLNRQRLEDLIRYNPENSLHNPWEITAQERPPELQRRERESLRVTVKIKERPRLYVIVNA